MTVSIGEETKGVLRVIRLVIGVSKATSVAAKPGMRGQQATRQFHGLEHTDVARKDQEVVVSQAAVDLRVEQCLRVESISI